MPSPIQVVLFGNEDRSRSGIRQVLLQDPDFIFIVDGTREKGDFLFSEDLLPDLVLLEQDQPSKEKLKDVGDLKAIFPQAKFVLITKTFEMWPLFEAMRWGIQGYLVKNSNMERWADYLKAIVREESLPTDLINQMIKTFAENYHVEISRDLTYREKEIIRWVAQGVSNKEIAEKLQISEYTVKNHLKNIFNKLNLKNRVQLVRYAYELYHS
ncbi:DNA-binding response regulator [Terrilactibacillus sp. BCM23-1]|uniref:DNA-binding response regulator n=1 Tax=Terrilactibacillus tamarindi TaxID=2599694 RepID=A0A6N8CL65_9BACI|nr:response regulator transcription factor [Terrilactibacillus tamarindi]MTT30602.1 DNA-binding response regulator [Terrilactibacillus tamarindi]